MAYFLKKTNNKKGTYLQIYFSFYDPVSQGTKHKSFKPIGYVHELQEAGIKDPIAHFSLEVNELNQQLREEKQTLSVKKIGRESPLKHLGYFPLASIWNQLDLDKWLHTFQAESNHSFDMAEVLRWIVLARAVHPCSKKKTTEQVIPSLLDSPAITYDQILATLESMGSVYEKIVEILTHAIGEKYGLDSSATFFDCTNFYFEIDQEDWLRRKGPSKENRKEPIVGMGLLLDAQCIPVAMKLYPGNQSEKPVLRQAISEMKKQNKLSGRTIQVADKGLNCAQNIYEARKNKDGYIFSKSDKMLPQTEKTWVLLNQDWHIVYDKHGEEKYRWKECVDSFDYSFTFPETGKKKKFSSKEKRVVTYNPKLAKKQKMEINKLAAKAHKLAYATAKKNEFGESSKYVKFESVNEDGVINDQKPVATVDEAAIQKDIELAGYNLLVTSETGMEAEEIYRVYHQLWRIEESFRVMKSELDARPVYLQKPERIAGHFLACYIAVVLTRIFQIKILHDKYGSSEIYDLFHDFKVTKAQRQYVNCSRNNDLIEDMSRVYKLPLTNYFLTSKELKKVLNYRLVPMV